MRALVTGAAGFVGRHLVLHLKQAGEEITALVHPRDASGAPRPFPELPDVTVAPCDLLDEPGLARVVEAEPYDTVYHLAAFSNPESSMKNARQTLETNVLGTDNLLRALARRPEPPRVLLVGSAQQYGRVEATDQPIGEGQAQRPVTPYGVSKSAQELLGQGYFLSGALPVYWTRSFNHTGPGQSDAYVCSSFARQIVAVEKGAASPEIRVGNLEARRDFSDVRDVVRAYRAILERGRPGRAYNVCSGEAVAVRFVLDRLVELSSAELSVRVDPDRYHAVDVPVIVGDPRRLREDTGFVPEHSLEDTLLDLLRDWRGRI